MPFLIFFFCSDEDIAAGICLCCGKDNSYIIKTLSVTVCEEILQASTQTYTFEKKGK